MPIHELHDLIIGPAIRIYFQKMIVQDEMIFFLIWKILIFKLLMIFSLMMMIMMLKIDMIIEIIQIWEDSIDDGNVNNDYDDDSSLMKMIK